MNVPGTVTSTLEGEEVAARVDLDGDDALFVTPSRTLVYRSEGLLSDESTESFPHDAERVGVDAGRRKATVSLDYGTDGERTLAVPADRVDAAVHAVLAGVFNARGVTAPGESVLDTYRFSELTLVVTSDRIVKHVGEATWDEEYEEVAFEDVTGFDAEEGNVASQLVLETAGRTERIKTPNERAREVREAVESALFDYHDVATREEFERAVGTAAEADPGAEEEATEGDAVSFADSGLEPIESTPAESEAPGSAGGFGASEFETATADGEDAAAELDALREAVERQRDLIADQQAAIERLAERLSRDP